MQLVAVDLLGTLPETSVGNKYILVAGDYFTKWMEVYTIPNQEATTVAQKLVKEMFCRFSPPEALHSDQGQQFESTLVAQICQLLHIKKTCTTPYHPQSDGLIERFNRTLLNLLSTWMSTLSNNWDDSLKELCMAYNTSVQSTTGYTPFFLMFGREAHLPVDIMFGSTDFGNSQPEPYVSYTLRLKEKLKNAYDHVCQRLSNRQLRQKEFYDQKVHGKPFCVNDLVWLHNPVSKGSSRKFHSPWSGPYKVCRKLSEVNYEIQHLGNHQRKIVHFDRLKQCRQDMRMNENEKERGMVSSPTAAKTPLPPGSALQLLDGDDQIDNTPGLSAGRNSSEIPRRYSSRNRRPPDRLTY